MSDARGTEPGAVYSGTVKQSPSDGLEAQPMEHAAASDAPAPVDGQSGAITTIEAVPSYWQDALTYVDALHTDAVLLVLGLWLCAGIMLARILLDRVVR